MEGETESLKSICSLPERSHKIVTPGGLKEATCFLFIFFFLKPISVLLPTNLVWDAASLHLKERALQVCKVFSAARNEYAKRITKISKPKAKDLDVFVRRSLHVGKGAGTSRKTDRAFLRRHGLCSSSTTPRLVGLLNHLRVFVYKKKNVRHAKPRLWAWTALRFGKHELSSEKPFKRGGWVEGVGGGRGGD